MLFDVMAYSCTICFSARAVLISSQTLLLFMLCILFHVTSIVYTLYINLNIQIHSHSVTDEDSWFCQNLKHVFKT